MATNKQTKIEDFEATADPLIAKKKTKSWQIGCNCVRLFSQLDGLKTEDASANPPWLQQRIAHLQKQGEEHRFGITFGALRLGNQSRISFLSWLMP